MICNLLKMTNSIKTELIPWSTNYLENKTFTWTLSTFDETKMSFNILFDYPLFISTDSEPDVMKITFLNTPFFLVP